MGDIMKTTKEEYQYCKAVYNEVFIRNHISKGFASFCKEKDMSFFQNQLENVRIYIYRPSYKNKKAKINYYCREILFLKAKILQKILSFVNFYINLLEIERALYYQEGKCFAFLETFFGSYFLSTFDEENMAYIPYILNHHSKDYLRQLIANFVTSTDFFERIKRLEFTIRLYEQSPNEPFSRVMMAMNKTKRKETFHEGYERIIEQLSLDDDFGSFFVSENGAHVFLPFYASLDSVFHEMGHFFFTELMGVEQGFGRQIKNHLGEGVFRSENPASIEILTQFLSSKSRQQISTLWPYLLYEENCYNFFLSFIEPFWERFQSLIIYYMKENRPNALEYLLGPSFLEYKQLLESFDGFNKRIIYDKSIVISYIDQMEEYLKTHDFYSSESFLNGVNDLESQGKRVRILNASYQKLLEEEQFLSSVRSTF